MAINSKHWLSPSSVCWHCVLLQVLVHPLAVVGVRAALTVKLLRGACIGNALMQSLFAV